VYKIMPFSFKSRLKNVLYKIAIDESGMWMRIWALAGAACYPNMAQNIHGKVTVDLPDPANLQLAHGAMLGQLVGWGI